MEIGPRRDALASFVRRIEARSVINDEERLALLELPGTPQVIGAHREFVRLGEEMQHACLVTEGIVARFAQLDDGSRQTIGFHIPGDMVDLYSMMLPRAPSPLQALTHAGILKIPHHALREAAFRHPGIASALWRDCVADGHIVAQWLVNIGRRNAQGRMAHLLCEMAVRFTQIGRFANGSFPFRVTQEQLAEALGLTSVHVNRSLKVLREDGLVRLTRSDAFILDWEGLKAAAEFDPAYLNLPAASSEPVRAIAR